MPYRTYLALVLIVVAIAGCAVPVDFATPVQPSDAPAAVAEQPAATASVPHPGMGPGSGMAMRHHSVLPEEYAGLTSPVEADADSLARGQTVYETNCATCHGDTGMGEGPTGQALNPAVAAVAHTSQMMTDAYLFWRISDGGMEFGTAMPPWGDILSEQERWDVINYMRALGTGSAPGIGRGPQARMGRADHHAEMLANAIAQGVITEADVELFESVHQILDGHYRASDSNMEGMGDAGMAAMQRAITDQAARDGRISLKDAERFTALHDLLIAEGLMQ